MLDDELAARLRKGDAEALEFVMERYTRLLWNIAGAILTNTGAAEDVEECVSDVFAELWRNPYGWDPRRGGINTYLALLAKRRALNLAKKIRRTTNAPLEDTVSLGDAASLGDVTVREVLNREAGAAVFTAMDSLAEPDREIFVRRHLLGQKPDAIARAMSLSVRQVTNKLYRSRGKLKARLQLLGQEGNI